jgi:hypothetical protein
LRKQKNCGKSTYTGKDGKQKAAVYKEDLGKGQSLKDYLNKGGGNNPSKDKNNNPKALRATITLLPPHLKQKLCKRIIQQT